MHDHMTELFYHRYDGTAEIISGQTGCTQGDSLGMQLFCLGLHTILCEAQLQGECVRIFAIADDVTLVGPREESLKVIEKLRELCGRMDPPLALARAGSKVFSSREVGSKAPTLADP